MPVSSGAAYPAGSGGGTGRPVAEPRSGCLSRSSGSSNRLRSARIILLSLHSPFSGCERRGRERRGVPDEVEQRQCRVSDEEDDPEEKRHRVAHRAREHDAPEGDALAGRVISGRFLEDFNSDVQCTIRTLYGRRRMSRGGGFRLRAGICFPFGRFCQGT